MAPFIPIAFEALTTLIPTLIRHFGSGKQTEKNAQVVEKVVKTAQEAVGAINEQDLITRIQNDPAALQAADKAIAANWLAITEVGGGIPGAREFAVQMTSEGPPWRQIAFSAMLGSLAVGVVLGGGAVMAWLLTHGVEESQAAQILDYFKAAGFIVLGYVFGSSAGSRRKDELVR